jgi:DNA-directed RNA polymerase subunit RPC12/RpoP
MRKFLCPSCGAEVAFRSQLSVYAVCKYCSSMIVHHDVDVEAIGKMAALPEDMSPLQIGSEGYYQGTRFTLVGRMKMGWKDGSWNEWFMASDDGRKGWLAEAQGFYAICFEVEAPALDFAVRAIKQQTQQTSFIGSAHIINQQKFHVVDSKKASCLGSEGELPLSAPQGRLVVSVDLLGSYGEFASVEIETGKLRAYSGRYVGWKEMRCTNIRTFDGW